MDTLSSLGLSLTCISHKENKYYFKCEGKFHLKKVQCAFAPQKYNKRDYKIKWRVQIPTVAFIKALERLLLEAVQSEKKDILKDQTVVMSTRLYEYLPNKFSIDTVVPASHTNSVDLFPGAERGSVHTLFDIKPGTSHSILVNVHALVLDCEKHTVTYSLGLHQILE